MKKHAILILCALLMLSVLSACGGRPAAAPADDTANGADFAYRKITAEDGKALMDSEADFVLVDVRRTDEYEEAHIPGAINIPNESIEETQPDALSDLDAAIVVYCRSGVRSKQAAEKLVAMGFNDVRDMGGINAWPYETVSGAEPGEWL